MLVRDVPLSPAFSDDAELVLSYARRGRQWREGRGPADRDECVGGRHPLFGRTGRRIVQFLELAWWYC